MASATRETVTKEIVTTVEEPVIRLELTERQAEVIIAMAKSVSGNAVGTYRKETTEIQKALQHAGVYAYASDYFSGTLTAKATYNLFD